MLDTAMIQEDDPTWFAYELQGVSLGDKRLDWRILDTGAKLAARPSASINQACADWADTKATYRLFDNKKTTAAKILLPHQQRTQERMVGYDRVLLVQDSSYLDYSQHPHKAGLGPIGTTTQQTRGLVMHSALATTARACPGHCQPGVVGTGSGNQAVDAGRTAQTAD